MKNMGKLAADGKLVVAGPMMDDTGLEGIFVFQCKNSSRSGSVGLRVILL
jgi:uncharacterized protein YciI